MGQPSTYLALALCIMKRRYLGLQFHIAVAVLGPLDDQEHGEC